MQKIVITGGAGFIGSHLAEASCKLESQPEVVVLDNLRSGRQANLDRLSRYKNFSFHRGSVEDLPELERVCQGADCIFHLAAMVSVNESLEKPLECVDINVRGTLNVVFAARKQAVRRIVFSSTCAVYGDEPEQPKSETHRPAPLTPYGITKLDGEFYLDMALREYGISTTSLRYFNVFGPYQDPKSQYAAAVPIFWERARSGKALTIFGDGQQTRDFIHVQDVAAANLWVAHRPELTGVFNVATGNTVTILELATMIRDLTHSTSRIEHAPPRPGDIRDSSSDPSKLLQTGFRPEYTLEKGLKALAALDSKS